MKNTKKKLDNKTGIVKSSFQQVDVASSLSINQACLRESGKLGSAFVHCNISGNNITKYSGLNVVAKYIHPVKLVSDLAKLFNGVNQQKIIKSISKAFPPSRQNATKFGINQIMLSVVFASMSGINRLNKIAMFTEDGLVRSLIKLCKRINKDALSSGLKKLGQAGSRTLQILLLSKNSRWLANSGIETITLDADSIVKPGCGNQQRAAKGFNSKKKGAKSYHPSLVFVSEMKLHYHSWFKTGSAYTSNGISDFLREVRSSLPGKIKKVFFRTDSGFFSGKLFELLESFDWDYLVKVKLKNLNNLLKKQAWEVIDENKDIAICEFEYKAGSWEKARIIKVVQKNQFRYLTIR